MSRNELIAEEVLYDRLSYLAYTSSGSTNVQEKSRMKQVLFRAIRNELSEKQRLCLMEYYINGRKKKEIAAILSLNPSTVTRHIRRAEEKLRHIASYY